MKTLGMLGVWRRQTHRMAAPNGSNSGAKRVEWRCQTSNTRDAVTLALKVEEVVEEEDCDLARIGHLFGTANDGAVLADIAVRLYFADNGAIDAHIAVALDLTDDAAMLANVAIALNLALDRAIDPDVAIALKTALDGAVDAHVAIAFDAAYYTAALADGGVTCLSLHADGEEQQEDSQFAKDVESLFHSFKEKS